MLANIDFLKTSIVIIAEIDEDEILTNYFLDNADYYLEKIVNIYKNRKIKEIEYSFDTEKLNRVDVNEYSKTKGDKVLYTKGVSTCSAAIIFKPGKFGYLSHISPLDKTYYSNYFIEFITEFTLKYFYNTTTTDFLKEITQRII